MIRKRLPVLIALIGCVACGAGTPTAPGAPADRSAPAAPAILAPSPSPGGGSTAADPSQAASPPPASPAASSVPGLPPPQERPIGGPRHLLIEIDGTAILHQANWLTELPVSFGTLLADGDQLTVHGQARLLCADLRVVPVPADQRLRLGSDLCSPAQAARINLPEGLAQALRKPNSGLPYVISPRATSIREAQPLIRWNDTGQPPYTVTISAADQVWSQKGLQEDRVRYPGTPPLQSGTAYIVSVEDASGRRSDEEGAPGLGFQLVDEQAARQIAADLALIDQAGLPQEAAAYARGWLLASQGLMAEALEELQAQPASAAALLASGDVAYRIRLVRLARTAYAAAVAQAEAANDQPMLAAALAGLGNTLSDEAAATAALVQARDLFASFGDSARVQELDEYIELSQL